jgi:hypothetical protein
MYVHPDPQVARQVDPRRPMIFWRDGAGGRREGLLLVAWACPFPECDDRHMDLAGYLIDDAVEDVEMDEFGIWTAERDGEVEDLEPALFGAFDLEEGRLLVEPRADPALAEWLRRELDREVVAALHERYRISRERAGVLARLLASGGQRVGRNQPCPCGSGKKYKRCCLGTA